jgi:hypothetical protein
MGAKRGRAPVDADQRGPVLHPDPSIARPIGAAGPLCENCRSKGRQTPSGSAAPARISAHQGRDRLQRRHLLAERVPPAACPGRPRSSPREPPTPARLAARCRRSDLAGGIEDVADRLVDRDHAGGRRCREATRPPRMPATRVRPSSTPHRAATCRHAGPPSCARYWRSALPSLAHTRPAPGAAGERDASRYCH